MGHGLTFHFSVFFQLRNAVATLAGEGFVVFHGDSVKRV